MEVLAKRLKWLREQKRLSQKEVAAEIGVSLNGYQKIESGERNPKLDNLIKFAKMYGVATDFLLGLKNTNDYAEKLRNNLREEYVDFERYSEINTKLTYDKNMLQERLDRFDKELASDSYRETMLALNKVNEDKAKYEYEMYQTLSSHLMNLIEYIKYLSNVPEVSIKDDEIIKQYIPLRISRSTNIFNKIDISLYSNDRGHLGYLDENLTEEEADEIENKFRFMFNEVLIN